MIPLAQLLEQAWARALPGREAATRNEALRTFQSGSEGLVALKGVKRAPLAERPSLSEQPYQDATIEARLGCKKHPRPKR